MKKFLILLIFVFVCSAFLSITATAGDNKSAGGDEILRKSQLVEDPYFGPWRTSYPYPFGQTTDPYPKTNPAVSTGYYFVDNRDVVVNDYRLWRPVANIVDTNFESNLWRRILSGPHQQPPGYWPHENGFAFFRSWKTNSGSPITGSWFDYTLGEPNDVDTTDNAYAGPMPIGFDFYFNGVRYDSFYVSTNGIVALTNRRYYYNSFGERTPPQGAQHCYDYQSMDWFVGPGAATPAGYPDRVTSRSLTICNDEDGTADPITDDFGFNIAVYNFGNSHTGPNPGGYAGTILQAGGELHQLNTKLPVIAPFFGDLHLSQYNPVAMKAEDWGKAYYKKSISGDSLIIYFVNAVLKGGVVTPFGTYNVAINHRPNDGADAYLGANAQVCLTRRDSSITITYEKFEGILSSGFYIAWRSDFLFRWNTTCGVRGFARHSNFNSKDPTAPVPPLCTGNPYYPYTNEYEQTTYYFDKYRNPQEDLGIPEASVAVKFKSWKNVVRVIGIKYMLRQELPELDPSYTDLFQVEKSADQVIDKEFLAGHRQLGAMQPVALLQNLTNDIQGPNGINYQEQDVTFRARFMINNQATLRTIYNRSVPINNNCLALPDPDPDNLCMGVPNVKVRYVHVTNFTTLATSLNPYPGPSNLNGIPPYGYVEVFFPPFIPNPLFENHIGRMHARIIAEPQYYDEILRRFITLGDQWPFDDTTSTRFFVMRRIPNDVTFKDDVTEYHVVQDINGASSPIPSVLKWVTFNADVVNGDEVSQHPLPPRGSFKADNSRMADDSLFYANYFMQSPAILMDRNPQPSQVRDNGDEIRSYPIDMTGKKGAVLSISIQRSLKRDDWERGFADAELVGCEQRVIVGGNWAATVGIGSATADEILVQYAKSSPDRVKGICWLHGGDLTWNELPQKGTGAVTWPDGHAGALRLYGGGGYVIGYNEKDYNQAYPMAYNAGTREKHGLRNDVYDDGIDAEYKKFIMTIPDRFIEAPEEGAFNFRFRIKVWADDNQMLGAVPGIPDDNDPFYVDNVRILVAGEEEVDLECNSVRVIWPYSVTPASQAIAIPIRVKVSNNTGASAPAYWVKVRIFKFIGQSQIDDSAIYCRSQSQASLHAGEQTEIKFPDWNARKTPPGLYRIVANTFIPYDGGDLEPLNDTTYYDFDVKYGDCFQYDPADNRTNDVPEGNFGALNGRGLNMYGFSMGGGVYATTAADNPSYKREWEAGRESGSGSGQIAMKFELFQADTIFGYKVFFGPLNQQWSEIVQLSLYDGLTLPSTMVEGTEVAKNRGLDDIRDKKPFWDQYVTYLLPQPKFLQAGSYWMTVSQQGETGLELGASKSRVAMRTTDTYTSNPPGDGQFQNGSGSIFLILDKNLRTATRTEQLLNLNVFAYENTKGSNTWYPFMNTQGNPAYGHLEYRGRVPDATTTPTYTRGTWIPMIAPYFGIRTFGTTLEYEPCPDFIPVELTSFNGQVRGNRVDLFWETASELNNYGFHVEKAVDADNDDYKWNTIGFVKGQGSTNSVTDYNYTDNNIEYGKTYHYRLRQVDLNGTQSCESYSNIVTLTIDGNGDIVLEPNAPNPFNNSTKIAYYLPDNKNVKIDVLDIYGNVIKSLVNKSESGQKYIDWNGTDENGNKVSSGTYILRLVAGDEIRTCKMTVVR
ncbi:MAG: T9SS type A sorting domain-containing protein [Bacteroidetes bacterium]|nr:MAG: T9SS type A sorting domain-containing protein [Bacteroidota bacterium]